MKKICVIGLGYIGLPTACVLANHGFKVVGVDINNEIILKLANGEPHIKEPGLRTLVESAIKSGNLITKNVPEEADAFIIAAPTPITKDKRADLSYVKSAAESIVPYLKKGNLVILESTSPPGTTEHFLSPILAKSNLKIGEDLFVAYCPERVLPGKILKELIGNDRVIGGITLESGLKAKEIYLSFIEGNIYLTDATTAEMVKLMENTYRDVNIALANELAGLCEDLGVNAWEVIELANKHPRVNLHKPGPGVGGHCIPVDPWFIVEKFPEKAKLIKQSREINDHQPHNVFEIICSMTKDIPNPKVAVLGVSFKGNVDDARESPAIELIRLLKKNNFIVAAHDPYVENFECELVSLEEAFKGADLAVVLADHDDYKRLNLRELGMLMRHKKILDTKHVLNEGLILAEGFIYRLIGKGRI
jgi:UDP-N-acetyl-D-mannosaminuronic acid dehydrogenase